MLRGMNDSHDIVAVGSERSREKRAQVMKVDSAEGGTLIEIDALERDGNDLLIKGNVLGTMPMAARLTPAEARKGLRLLSLRLVLFLLSFLFRR